MGPELLRGVPCPQGSAQDRNDKAPILKSATLRTTWGQRTLRTASGRRSGVRQPAWRRRRLLGRLANPLSESVLQVGAGLATVGRGQRVDCEQALAGEDRGAPLPTPVGGDRVLEQHPPLVDPGRHEQDVLGHRQRAQVRGQLRELVRRVVQAALAQADRQFVNRLQAGRALLPRCEERVEGSGPVAQSGAEDADLVSGRQYLSSAQPPISARRR